VKPDLVSRGSQIIIADLNVRPNLVSRGSRIIIAEKLNVRQDLVSRGSWIIMQNIKCETGSCIERITDHHCRPLNVRPDLASRGSRIIIADLRLTSYQQVKPKIIKMESCIERITVSTFQTLYREGLLSSEKTTLASLINIENACMNA